MTFLMTVLLIIEIPLYTCTCTCTCIIIIHEYMCIIHVLLHADRSGRISGHLYRRSSPLHSSHEQDSPHPSPSQSLQYQYLHSPVRSCPASINVREYHTPLKYSG